MQRVGNYNKGVQKRWAYQLKKVEGLRRWGILIGGPGGLVKENSWSASQSQFRQLEYIAVAVSTAGVRRSRLRQPECVAVAVSTAGFCRNAYPILVQVCVWLRWQTHTPFATWLQSQTHTPFATWLQISIGRVMLFLIFRLAPIL